MQTYRTTPEALDIWHDDEGIWRDIVVDGIKRTVGPFSTEDDAEKYEEAAGPRV